MSYLPFFFDIDNPRRRIDQQLPIAIYPEDLLGISLQQSNESLNKLNKLASALLTMRASGSTGSTPSTIKSDNNKFQINLDVQHFAPEEISVKTLDGFIVIEARHDERKDDHGWVARQFVRRYPLPEGCNIDCVQSRLSSDGVLTVTAPLDRPSNERIVPIIQTGPVKKRSEEAKFEGGDSGAPLENGQ